MKCWMHSESVLARSLFAAAIIDVIVFANKVVLIGLPLAEHLELMSETIEGYRHWFRKWKQCYKHVVLKAFPMNIQGDCHWRKYKEWVV